MTSTQKTIKYIAVGFACVLAFSIIAGIVAAGAGILNGIGIISQKAPEALVDCAQYEKCLSLQISYSELQIKNGDKIAVETSDNDYEIVNNDNNLVVKDVRRTSWFGGNNSRKIVVTIPEDMEFDVAGISSGAGRIEIERIVAKELNLSLGAGETIIKNVEVSDKATINTGAGKFAVESGKIKNAKVSLGVGDASIRAALTGSSKIDAGIGSVNLGLLMPASKYKIKVDKGIGEILFNGSSVDSGVVAQDGENEVDIDGGIGRIKITTTEE